MGRLVLSLRYQVRTNRVCDESARKGAVDMVNGPESREKSGWNEQTCRDHTHMLNKEKYRQHQWITICASGHSETTQPCGVRLMTLADAQDPRVQQHGKALDMLP